MFTNLKKKLDEIHHWPCEYTFKFIVKVESLQELRELCTSLHPLDTRFRDSKKGNFTSVTLVVKMESSEEVIAIYERAAKLPGVISL